jgi:site-specific recombinase XerD
MEAVLKAAEQELKLRGYSPKTLKAYLHHIERFARYCREEPSQLNEVDIRAYLLNLIERKQVSRAYHNQAVSALKFL